MVRRFKEMFRRACARIFGRKCSSETMKPIYNEESSIQLSITFKDESGSDYTPSDVTLRVDDDGTGQEMLAPQPLAVASTVVFTIPATANVILDSNKAVEHRTATVTANNGTSFEHNEVYKYSVRNFRFV